MRERNFWDRTEGFRVLSGMVGIPLIVGGTVVLAAWKLWELIA